jgi:hypothetical protein
VTGRLQLCSVTLTDFGSLLSAACYGLVAIVLVYDAKRAIWPRIPGEQPWRRARVAGTTTALFALSILQRAAGPLWFKRVAIVAFVVAVGVVVRCSIPLRQMVAASVRRRREAAGSGT